MYFDNISDYDSLKEIVYHDLQKYGITFSKKKLKVPEIVEKNPLKDYDRRIFGVHICLTTLVEIEGIGPVPRFLVDACNVILNVSIDTYSIDGIFRKTGNLQRQQQFKQQLSATVSVYDLDIPPIDLASLIKVYFRDLPEPLLTMRLYDVFLQAHALKDPAQRQHALLLTCLLLPRHNLTTLRYFMGFLHQLCSRNKETLMTAETLATCVAPNLISCPGKTESKESLENYNNIVTTLICRCQDIGIVDKSIEERLQMMMYGQKENLECGRDFGSEQSLKKRKKRSGSFQGSEKHSGFFTSLSSSFSRFGGSKKPNHGGTSFNTTNSILEGTTAGVGVEEAIGEDLPSESVTPHVGKKRKNDQTAFSHSKRQAILSNMPGGALLNNTPLLTPFHGKLRALSDDEDEEEVDFPGGLATSSTKSGSTGQGFSSPSTGSSPKTSKMSVSKKLRGFWKRRLSGGKESQKQQISHSLTAGPTVQRKRSIFSKRHHHHKTPSSPAKILVPPGPIVSRNPAATCQDEGEENVEMTPFVLHRRRYSEMDSNDTSRRSNTIRRGRPNTVSSGLPSPAKRRSLDAEVPILEWEAGRPTSTVDTSPIHRGLDEGGMTRQVSGASVASESPEDEHDKAFIFQESFMQSGVGDEDPKSGEEPVGGAQDPRQYHSLRSLDSGVDCLSGDSDSRGPSVHASQRSLQSVRKCLPFIEEGSPEVGAVYRTTSNEGVTVVERVVNSAWCQPEQIGHLMVQPLPAMKEHVPTMQQDDRKDVPMAAEVPVKTSASICVVRQVSHMSTGDDQGSVGGFNPVPLVYRHESEVTRSFLKNLQDSLCEENQEMDAKILLPREIDRNNEGFSVTKEKIFASQPKLDKQRIIHDADSEENQVDKFSEDPDTTIVRNESCNLEQSAANSSFVKHIASSWNALASSSQCPYTSMSSFRFQKPACPSTNSPVIIPPAFRSQDRRCRSPSRRAHLPIGTHLVHANSVQEAKRRIDNDEELHTATCPQLTVPDVTSLYTPIALGNGSSVKPSSRLAEVLSTPTIKPPLLTPNAALGKRRGVAVQSITPLKPLKRLQKSSPKSPNRRRGNTATKNVEVGFSPHPSNYNADWQV